jgi:hypothetical protein
MIGSKQSIALPLTDLLLLLTKEDSNLRASKNEQVEYIEFTLPSFPLRYQDENHRKRDLIFKPLTDIPQIHNVSFQPTSSDINEDGKGTGVNREGEFRTGKSWLKKAETVKETVNNENRGLK